MPHTLPFKRKDIPKGYRRVRVGEVIEAEQPFLIWDSRDVAFLEDKLSVPYRQVRYGAFRFIKKK